MNRTYPLAPAPGAPIEPGKSQEYVLPLDCDSEAVRRRADDLDDSMHRGSASYRAFAVGGMPLPRTANLSGPYTRWALLSARIDSAAGV